LATRRNFKGGILISQRRIKAKFLWARIVLPLGEGNFFMNDFMLGPGGESARVVLI
jgi:hypothetical protein